MRRLWLAAALILLIPAGIRWTHYFREHGLRAPQSPVEADQPQYAAYWRFLASARKVVPRGSSYTISASSTEEETQLFMISLDLFEGYDPKPASYWAPQAGGGRDARFVLAYQQSVCGEGTIGMIPVDGGSVCERPGP